MKRFYVKAKTAKGKVIGYAVYDEIGGMESEHGSFTVEQYGVDVALHLANTLRDDLNKKIL